MNTLLNGIKFWIESLLNGINKRIDNISKDIEKVDNLSNSMSKKMDKHNPSGTGSFSLNRDTNYSIGYCSCVEGYLSSASGDYSHAEGSNTRTGNYSKYGNTSSTSYGSYAHAEGYGTVAKGRASHAEGNGSVAGGVDSHAEGYNTSASGISAHSEGYNTNAYGSYAHSEGYSTSATNYSHSEGYFTQAKGLYSHAEGYNTSSNTDYSHAEGKYNIEGYYAHVVGNGTYNKRSNAHTLDWEGNAWYSGDVYVGSTSGVDKDDGSKKLATEEYVDNVRSDFIDKIITPTIQSNESTISRCGMNVLGLPKRSISETSYLKEGVTYHVSISIDNIKIEKDIVAEKLYSMGSNSLSLSREKNDSYRFPVIALVSEDYYYYDSRIDGLDFDYNKFTIWTINEGDSYYFYYMTYNQYNSTTNVMSTSCQEFTITEITESINEKYIPDTIATKEYVDGNVVIYDKFSDNDSLKKERPYYKAMSDNGYTKSIFQSPAFYIISDSMFDKILNGAAILKYKYSISSTCIPVYLAPINIGIDEKLCRVMSFDIYNDSKTLVTIIPDKSNGAIFKAHDIVANIDSGDWDGKMGNHDDLKFLADTLVELGYTTRN